MLVLVRRRDEDVYITTLEGRITIRVLGVQSDFEGESINPRVRLGIDAPAGMNIVRGELLGNNGSAAVSNGKDLADAR